MPSFFFVRFIVEERMHSFVFVCSIAEERILNFFFVRSIVEERIHSIFSFRFIVQGQIRLFSFVRSIVARRNHQFTFVSIPKSLQIRFTSFSFLFMEIYLMHSFHFDLSNFGISMFVSFRYRKRSQDRSFVPTSFLVRPCLHQLQNFISQKLSKLFD